MMSRINKDQDAKSGLLTGVQCGRSQHTYLNFFCFIVLETAESK